MTRLACAFQIARITLVAILTAPAALHADTLTGSIVDAQGLALVNANVRLLDRTSGEQRNTVSGKDGRYSFDGIRSGMYVIEADAADSALIGSQEVNVRGNQTLNLTLKIAAAQSVVQVTSSSTPQTITEVAKAVDVVSGEQINLRGVFQITEAVRILPGVQVKTQEGPGSFTTIRTRGLRSFDTAVLIDGLRFQDSGSPQNDVTGFLEDLMTTDTERVELLRGSSSSLYGSSAMAGVMNIVSRSGGAPTHGELRAEGGGLGMFRGVAGVGGGAADNRVNYSGSLSYVNIANGVRDESPYDNTSAQGMVRFSPRPQMTLTGRVWSNSADLTSSENPAFTPSILANSTPGTVPALPLPTDQLELFERGLPFNPGNATYIPNQIDPDGNRLSSFFSGTVTWQHAVSSETTYRIAYQGVDTRRGYRDGPLGTSNFDPLLLTTSHFNGRTATIQARVDHRLGARNFVTAGYEFMGEKYFNFNDTEISDVRTDEITLSQRSHALYAQDQAQLAGGRLQVTVAGRMQFFDLDQPDFSGTATNPYEGNIGTIDTPNAYTGDISAAYFFQNSQTKLRAHGGNSYRAPSSSERFGGDLSFGATYFGDPRLKPERAVAFDGGVDQWLFNSKVQVSGTLFWTDLEETIRFESTLPPDDPFERFFGFANGSGGDANGVELSAHFSPTRRTQAQISYTYVNSESDTPTFGANYFKTLGLSPHTFALSFTQWVSPRFHATFDLFAKSGYDLTMFGAANRLFQFDGTAKANLMLGYELPIGGRKGLEIYTRIENLFDQVPYEDGFIGPGFWAVGGVRFSY
jgi:vitamin B12 transporter